MAAAVDIWRNEKQPVIDMLEEAESLFANTISEGLKRIPFTGLNRPLYHFTDTNGLQGILRTRSLWASLAMASADSSEIRYALARVKALLQDRRVTGEPWFLDGVVPFLDPQQSETIATLGMKVYVVSFRTESDASDHWGTYGRSGAGVALAFALKPLVIPGLLAIPVLYDPVAQDRLLGDFIESAWLLFEGLLRKCPEHLMGRLRERGLQWTALGVWVLAPLLKAPEFSAEREWRLVVVDLESVRVEHGHGVGKNVLIRRSDNGDVPYKVLRYDCLPIVGLELGINASLEPGDEVLRSLLRDATCGRDVPIARSRISARPANEDLQPTAAGEIMGRRD